ncbi:hypothetical protein HPO96_15045 [Kribbella sandramycini]|uniref:Uncharacterized protein n=1 Tax=Kribbella sandramycini TaxID=60450 RepID=A0A7Y4L164_9ACTN|nr:hypothetical protein [Kribbella sandramycini]MBB6565292.1 hypothetical protein [Kribbella sandramycini]NOL41561.1 hypothetical protein [Kribbella sandramycini]
MTETELHQRLRLSVDDVHADDDLILRARQGGTRRLRRRRLTTAGISALAVLAVGAVAVAGPAVYNNLADAPVAGETATSDPYGFLLKGATRGDLANDEMITKALEAWQKTRDGSQRNGAGLFKDLQGEPKVYWVGTTASGPAAIVAQRANLRNGNGLKLEREGAHTVVGFIGADVRDEFHVLTARYAAAGMPLTTGFMAGMDGPQSLVVLDVGKKTGLSPRRVYSADGASSRREFTPLTFKDGVSVTALPKGAFEEDLSISTLPAVGPADQRIAFTGYVTPEDNKGPFEPDRRMWVTSKPESWAMSPRAETLQAGAWAKFEDGLAKAKFWPYFAEQKGTWVGYGMTPDRTEIYLGQRQLDDEPTRAYAVVVPKNGRPKVVSAEFGEDVTPVRIKLPDNLGWVLAQKDGVLSYRVGGGAWSAGTQNALFVPAGANVEARTKLEDSFLPVTLP